MNIDKLRQVKKLVTHDGCPDGLASALIIKDVMPWIEIEFMAHGSAAHRNLPCERGLLFCDFTPYVERDKTTGVMTDVGLQQARAWVSSDAIVLDHHKGSGDLVVMFGEDGVFADEKTRPGVAGAVLAYDEVWWQLVPQVPPITRDNPHYAGIASVRHFASIAGIRDTWQTESPNWRESCEQAAALMFWPREVLLRETLHHVIDRRLSIGEALLRRDYDADTRTLATAHRFEIDGVKVVTFEMGENSRPVSDISERLGAEADLVVGWHYLVEDGTPKMRVSSRSRGSRVKAIDFAKRYGGSGHTNAAGFKLPVIGTQAAVAPYAAIELLVCKWLVANVTPVLDEAQDAASSFQ